MQADSHTFKYLFRVRGASPPPAAALERTIYTSQALPTPFLDTPEYKSRLERIHENLGNEYEAVSFDDLATILHALEIDILVQKEKIHTNEEFITFTVATDLARNFLRKPEHREIHEIYISFNKNEEDEWVPSLGEGGTISYFFTPTNLDMALDIIHSFERSSQALEALTKIAQKMAKKEKLTQEEKDEILSFIGGQQNRFKEESENEESKNHILAKQNAALLEALFQKILAYQR